MRLIALAILLVDFAKGQATNDEWYSRLIRRYHVPTVLNSYPIRYPYMNPRILDNQWRTNLQQYFWWRHRPVDVIDIRPPCHEKNCYLKCRLRVLGGGRCSHGGCLCYDNGVESETGEPTSFFFTSDHIWYDLSEREKDAIVRAIRASQESDDSSIGGHGNNDEISSSVGGDGNNENASSEFEEDEIGEYFGDDFENADLTKEALTEGDLTEDIFNNDDSNEGANNEITDNVLDNDDFTEDALDNEEENEDAEDFPDDEEEDWYDF